MLTLITASFLIIGQNGVRSQVETGLRRGGAELIRRWRDRAGRMWVSAKLGVMVRLRNSFVWALAGTAALALFLMLVCHPVLKLDAGTGMSAPPASRASIEFAPAMRVAPSQGDPQFVGVGAQRIAVARVALHVVHEARHCAGNRVVEYAPLYRRPPPSLS